MHQKNCINLKYLFNVNIVYA